ncbi:ABC transporter substrate-binding protein [Frankia sp. AgB1.9]|uniref:ABC transporter substrate-binding protein n=1 Tax=unclassified Frankia TaxID=2632575 RepID=UPI001932215E|nr:MULTISPECIES: ABC transporter substrate-binding protein [unclassified Frankia]MBL7489949.1 ABC transporter substrate-binding protein [Frankia sp. AgW1.1]MBL7552163.1 ABC transporter substrate-binding protein [Frankia sp. AgB1.9]MBL7625240.1 ABC transporter substrate-binding protein [Frankia sp. AgB1.8]
MRIPGFSVTVGGGLLPAAVAVTLAAGCAAAGGGDGSTGPTAACDTPGYSANEIRLGFVYPDTGPTAPSLSSARAGFEARVGEANAAGGIHGRKITYIWRDDGGTAEQNQQAVADLVDNQTVFGLVEATTVASGGAEFLREQGVPVAGIPAEAFWADPRYGNMFTYSYLFTNGPSVTTFGDYAKEQGGTRAAVIQSDVTADANDIGTKISDSLASAGIPIAPGPFVYNPAVTDPVQLGQRLRAAGVDVVAAAFAGTDLAEVIRGIKAAGAPVKVILTPSGYDTSLLRRYGPMLSGLTAAVSYVPFEQGGPAHETYLEAMAAYAPEVTSPNQEVAFATYILTDLFLDGLDEAGDCPTRAGFIHTLRASSYDAGGLLPGPVDLTKDFGQIARCYTFLKVNTAGTGYVPVPNPKAPASNPDQWCGTRLSK